MTFLEQLRGETSPPLNTSVPQTFIKQKQEKTHQKILLLKMQSIFLFLKEIILHLNYLDKAIRVYQYSARFSALHSLIQKNYQLNTDGFGGFADFEHIEQINLTFICCAQGSFNYNLEGANHIADEITFLNSKNMIYTANQFIHKKDIEAVHFKVERKIPVRFRFETTIESSKITLLIDNHQDFNHYQHAFNPDDMNEAFFNKMIRFILRKDNSFMPPPSLSNAIPLMPITEYEENSKLFSRLNLFNKWKN
ncbi:MAG: hypothetical protein KAG26_04760 [Methylococcales bacterium]|nr:hypothetical protein [Methylococcales bacterium]